VRVRAPGEKEVVYISMEEVQLGDGSYHGADTISKAVGGLSRGAAICRAAWRALLHESGVQLYASSHRSTGVNRAHGRCSVL
jgi:hypothetical protein